MFAQERFHYIAEDILPESQCSFRKGHGCYDMMFVALQLLEKAREHQELLFIFVGLRKAYKSVSRNTLWKVLKGLVFLLKVVKSFHEGMHAVVKMGGSWSECLEVRNGLRQGCSLAPALFNLYFSAVVTTCRSNCI